MKFSTSFHPQTDGQTERVNGLLECYLWHFISGNQKNWVHLLDVAQFSYNLQVSEATGKSPFEIVTGQQPTVPVALPSGYTDKDPVSCRMAKQWTSRLEETTLYLEKAARKMKKWAYKHRGASSFKVGDKVFFKVMPTQFRSHRKLHKGLVPRYKGPYEIIRKVGKVSFELKLPQSMIVHPVFHASMLKPYYGDLSDSTEAGSPRPQVTETPSLEPEIVEILDHRAIHRPRPKPYYQFLVRWSGRAQHTPTWECEQDLARYTDAIQEYFQAAVGGGGCHAPPHFCRIFPHLYSVYMHSLARWRTLRGRFTSLVKY